MEKLERDWRQEQGKWLISSDFVKRIPKIDSRGEARRILRAMAKSGKVRIEQNPKRKTGYVFGLPEWKPPTKNDLNAKP